MYKQTVSPKKNYLLRVFSLIIHFTFQAFSNNPVENDILDKIQEFLGVRHRYTTTEKVQDELC